MISQILNKFSVQTATQKHKWHGVFVVICVQVLFAN